MTNSELTGKHPVKVLLEEPHRDWFVSGYEKYQPDTAVITELRNLTTNITITVFMGTWCGDSKEHIPHFYKILHEAGFDEKNVSLILCDRDKTTPEKLENGLGILKVPTFIFYKTAYTAGQKIRKRNSDKDKELNRITESPVETLEKDMLKIFTQQQYNHKF